MTTLLPRIEIESAPQPTAAVIWLHGLGADGNDFASLVPQLDLRQCPPIRFIFPHAPSMPITLNGGYVMPAWYDIASPSLVSRQDANGIQKSERAITALIEQQVARGIPYQNIVLAGFVALSGYLPLADRFADERHAANAKTPIFMAHGTQDPVVVLARGEDSRNALLKLGHTVNWHTYPMEHSVHPREVADISTFLTQVLGAGARATQSQ